ncbi:MAG: DUF2269 domain-containing protein [Chloroflexota bacterium]|nr:DUF2269 domain-containing protein [Chloroflexota bacterium]
MDSLYNWIVFLHIVGAFAFALTHGVSAAVALKLRQERDVPRVQALLDLSNVATQGMYVGLVILLIGGIIAAFMAGLWGRGWIWTAIVLLVLMIAFMYARASRYYGELRRAAGLGWYIPGKGSGSAGAANTADLGRLLVSSRPIELAVVGAIGLLVIIWLMVIKPF